MKPLIWIFLLLTIAAKAQSDTDPKVSSVQSDGGSQFDSSTRDANRGLPSDPNIEQAIVTSSDAQIQNEETEALGQVDKNSEDNKADQLPPSVQSIKVLSPSGINLIGLKTIQSSEHRDGEVWRRRAEWHKGYTGK